METNSLELLSMLDRSKWYFKDQNSLKNQQTDFQGCLGLPSHPQPSKFWRIDLRIWNQINPSIFEDAAQILKGSFHYTYSIWSANLNNSRFRRLADSEGIILDTSCISIHSVMMAIERRLWEDCALKYLKSTPEQPVKYFNKPNVCLVFYFTTTIPYSLHNLFSIQHAVVQLFLCSFNDLLIRDGCRFRQTRDRNVRSPPITTQALMNDNL